MGYPGLKDNAREFTLQGGLDGKTWGGMGIIYIAIDSMLHDR